MAGWGRGQASGWKLFVLLQQKEWHTVRGLILAHDWVYCENSAGIQRFMYLKIWTLPTVTPAVIAEIASQNLCCIAIHPCERTLDSGESAAQTISLRPFPSLCVCLCGEFFMNIINIATKWNNEKNELVKKFISLCMLLFFFKWRDDDGCVDMTENEKQEEVEFWYFSCQHSSSLGNLLIFLFAVFPPPLFFFV